MLFSSPEFLDRLKIPQDVRSENFITERLVSHYLSQYTLLAAGEDKMTSSNRILDYLIQQIKPDETIQPNQKGEKPEDLHKQLMDGLHQLAAPDGMQAQSYQLINQMNDYAVVKNKMPTPAEFISLQREKDDRRSLEIHMLFHHPVTMLNRIGFYEWQAHHLSPEKKKFLEVVKIERGKKIMQIEQDFKNSLDINRHSGRDRTQDRSKGRDRDWDFER